MALRRSLALCTALFVVVALLAAVAPTAAAPPPEEVCGACGSQFGAAVEDAGGSVSVAESALDVQVYANGSAHVVAENRLAAGSDWVANNREAVVAALAARDDGFAPTPSDAALRVTRKTVTVSYTTTDVARSSVGDVVLVDAFQDTASSSWMVNADHFRLSGPPGYAFTSGPSGTDNGVWDADRDDVLGTGFVAFAPDGGLVSTGATQLALAIETGPRFLANAALVLAVPVVALAGLLRGFDAVGGRLTLPAAPARAGTAVAAGSIVVLVALVASDRPTTYFMLWSAIPLFAALTGLAVGVLSATGRVHDWRALAVTAVGTPLALGVLAAIVGANAHPEIALRSVGRALTAGLLAAQLWTLAVVGAAGDAASDWLRLAAVVAPLVGVVALLGPGALLAPLVLMWLAVLALFGLPAYLLGAGLATRT